MPKYYKRSNRPKRNTTVSKSNDGGFDWFNLIYFLLIGSGAYLIYMMLRSVTLGTDNKSSFFDWLKNMGSILDDKISGLGSQNSSGSSGSSNDTQGNNGNSENGTNGLIKSQYFKESEYFPNCKPTDQKRVGNYNRLIKQMDRIRSEWGSEILVVGGFECDNSDKLPAYDECRAIQFEAQNGKTVALFDKVKKLANAGTILSGDLVKISIVENPKDSEWIIRYIIN
ncbi:hypothetical protein [Soonwooa purpurea]